MSSAADLSAVASWNNASSLMNRYFSILIFLFGTIGNLLNVLVLAQGTLRRNPCSLYFLVSSLANFIAIIAGLTTRMLSGWTLDLTNTNDSLCKLRAFTLFISRNIGSWLIMFAAMDRWLLSSPNAQYRRFSTFINAQWCILLTTVLSIILYGSIFYCYEANLTNAPLKCYGKTELCRYSNDFSYALLTIAIPIFIMMIFGLLTILNIRRSKTRVQTMSVIEMNHTMPSIDVPVSTTHATATTKTTKLSKRKIDRRLFFMLLIQIVLLALFTLPQAVQKIYSTLTTNEVQTTLKKAIDNFVFNLVLLLTYLANGMPFYIYTLSGGPLFRNALKHLIQNIGRKLCLNCLRICQK